MEQQSRQSDLKLLGEMKNCSTIEKKLEGPVSAKEALALLDTLTDLRTKIAQKILSAKNPEALQHIVENKEFPAFAKGLALGNPNIGQDYLDRYVEGKMGFKSGNFDSKMILIGALENPEMRAENLVQAAITFKDMKLRTGSDLQLASEIVYAILENKNAPREALMIMYNTDKTVVSDGNYHSAIEKHPNFSK